jgi:hypothetical protein
VIDSLFHLCLKKIRTKGFFNPYFIDEAESKGWRHGSTGSELEPQNQKKKREEAESRIVVTREIEEC